MNKRSAVVRSLILVTALMQVLLSCSSGELSQPPVGSESSDIPSWQMLVVTGDIVNLRDGPGTEYAVLGQVHEGDTLQITGGLEDWYRVYIRDLSLFAWIYGPLTTGAELPR